LPKKPLNLTIETRHGTGSTSARKLRAAGKLPAVLYGHGETPEHIVLDARAFEDVLHSGGRTGMVTLQGDGKNATVLVREIQRNPVSRKILHADLLRVSATETVSATLPVVTIGTARGVKDFGGVMDVVVHDLEVEGPANKLPDHLEVDVNELGLHEHATAADVKLPPEFKMITPGDTIVVAIEPSKTAQLLEEAAAAEAGVVEEQPEPEIIGAEPVETPEET
jgi:large subunit ribosomal protein L25